MAVGHTPALDLNLPEVGASRDVWGSLLNENFEVLDQFVQMAMPIGCVLDYAGPTAPDGWLICDGRTVSRLTYSQLFAAIGTVWGAGDGSTTFRLPPTSGRASVGPGNVIDETGATVAFTFAQIRGAVARPIVQANLPIVTITTDAAGSHNHTGNTAPGGNHNHITDLQGSHAHAYQTGEVPDHTHDGWTSVENYHNHSVSLPATGTGAAPGGLPVMSTSFGSTNYDTSYQGGHSHYTYDTPAGRHAHQISVDGSHQHTTTMSGAFQLGIYADGSHTHTMTLGGSGTGLDIMSPVVVVTKIIYAGIQASSRTISGSVAGAGATRHLAAPMRGRH